MQGGHSPPQSTPSSNPFQIPSEQETHGLHGPPQSMSASPWFCIPSLHDPIPKADIIFSTIDVSSSASCPLVSRDVFGLVDGGAGGDVVGGSVLEAIGVVMVVVVVIIVVDEDVVD